MTQIQFFRARFDSNGLGYLLFPLLVLLVIPYLLIGVIGAAKTIGGVTGPKKTPRGMIEGTFPDLFESTGGAIPPWLTGAVICIVVLCYIFAGGSRAAAWANTFQTLVFMTMGVLAFILISNKLGGLGAAIEQAKEGHLVRTVSSEGKVGVPPIMFATYMFIPLSVGMFPHLFQHWLTAKSAKAFKLTVIAHPICIMIVWVPCVLIGLWATGLKPLEGAAPAAVLAKMVGILVKDPVIVGLVTAGILAAIMSSLDSQFLCLGTIFTNDIVLHNTKKKYTDKQILLMARGFVLAIVVITYVLAMVLIDQNVFDLAVWCFSGFAALTPLVIAALYWRRSTKEGAIASIVATTVVWFYFFAKSGFGGEYFILGGVMPVAVCWLTGVVAMVAVSLATKPPSKETVDKFFP